MYIFSYIFMKSITPSIVNYRFIYKHLFQRKKIFNIKSYYVIISFEKYENLDR